MDIEVNPRGIVGRSVGRGFLLRHFSRARSQVEEAEPRFSKTLDSASLDQSLSAFPSYVFLSCREGEFYGIPKEQLSREDRGSAIHRRTESALGKR